MSGLGLTEMQKENVIKYWDYSYLHGPQKWFMYCKIGDCQSPIDISLRETRYDPKLAKSPLLIGREGVRFAVHNTGVSVNFAPQVTRNLTLEYGPLSDRYELGGIHLHWGKQDFRGSEHLIEGFSFAAELHMVHWNATKYKSLQDALTRDDGLCVLAIFLDLTNSLGHTAIDSLIELLPEVQFKGEKYETGHKIDPYSLLPVTTKHYWTYQGSLTTPPCTENVTWIVFKDPIPIDRKQLEQFRRLKAVPFWEGEKSHFDDPMSAQGPQAGTGTGPPKIGNNFRPVMPLGGRILRSSFSDIKI